MTIKNIAEPTIAKSANRTASNRMSSFLESASYWAGIAAVGLTAAAALAGSFAWYFSHKLSDKKDSEFNSFRESSRVAISEAQARSAVANARAAEANKIAEEERLARVKLEARLAFRSFSRQSRTMIADALRKFAPQTFAVLWYPDDQECQNLAELLAITLRDSGWVLSQSGEWLGFGLILGVRIEFAPSKSDKLAAACNALAFELNKVGVIAEVNGNPELDKPEILPDRIRIKVGKKPK